MSQQQQQTLVKIIEQLYRNSHAPVPTLAVASHYYMSDRNMRRLLNKLAEANHIQRVGKCKGWLPIAC